MVVTRSPWPWSHERSVWICVLLTAPSTPEKLTNFLREAMVSSPRVMCEQILYQGRLGLDFESPITAPAAAAPATMRLTRMTMALTRRCLAGAMAAPEG